MTNEILYINHYLYTTFQKHKTIICAYVHAKSLQSCPALCNSMHCNPPGSLFMGFSRQKYWSGLPCPPPGDLPNPGIKPVPPAAATLQADSLPLNHWGSPKL